MEIIKVETVERVVSVTASTEPREAIITVQPFQPREINVEGSHVVVGIPGKDGRDGIDGEKGDKGDKGDTGEQGAQGLQGIQGLQGVKGDVGAQGLKGDKGDTGANGANGTSINVIQATDQANALSLSVANPNNIYFW